MCERELVTEQNCNVLTPTLMAICVVSFSFSRVAQPEAWGPSPLGAVLSSASCHQRVISKLTDFLSSPSYIIVQSPTKYLWNDRSLSSGTSAYDCTIGFYLVSYCQPSPPTRFLPITAIGMCHFRRLCNGMFGRVEGQYTTLMLNWIVFKRTDYLHKIGFGIK